MAFIPDLIQRVFRGQPDHHNGTPEDQPQATCEGPDRSTILFPRQITVSVGPSSVTTLLCNPAHSLPGCVSCIGGTAYGTTPGCTTTAPTTAPVITTTTPQPTVVVSTPVVVPVTTVAPVATSTPATAATPATTTAAGSTLATSSSNQVVHSASQATSFAFTSVIVPSITTVGGTTKAAGGSAQATHIDFPTTPYTGQALLTGTCNIPMYTALVLSGGAILEAPIIGCGDDRPECCPSLAITSSATTSTNSALPAYESTAVASALSAYPISVCPSDYADLGSACCPAGFVLYTQAVVGQTPCYTVLATALPANAATAAVSYISAEIAATASPGSTPSVSIQVAANQVFALSLPHSTHHSGMGAGEKIGIGVGVGVGALLVLGLVAWVCLLRRKLGNERDVNRLSINPAPAGVDSGLIPVSDIPNRYSGAPSQRLSGITSADAKVDAGLIPVTANDRYSGIVRQSLPSNASYSQTSPSAGPSPPDMHVTPWAPYGPSGQQMPYNEYQQPQWQQAPGAAPYEVAGQQVVPQPAGYSELAGAQNPVYGAGGPAIAHGVDSQTGQLGGYQPVQERGPSDTPRLAHSVQSGGQQGSSVNF